MVSQFKKKMEYHLFAEHIRRKKPYQCSGDIHTISKDAKITDFLMQLKLQYTDLPNVLVMDNAQHQHCQMAIKNKIIESQHIESPPYSHNLNIIEVYGNLLKRKSFTLDIMIPQLNFIKP